MLDGKVAIVTGAANGPGREEALELARNNAGFCRDKMIFNMTEEGFDTFDPANIAPFVAYLSSPAAGNRSDQVFIVCGDEVSIVGRPEIADPERRFKNRGKWTLDRLDEELGPHFATRKLGDGYALQGN